MYTASCQMVLNKNEFFYYVLKCYKFKHHECQVIVPYRNGRMFRNDNVKSALTKCMKKLWSIKSYGVNDRRLSANFATRSITRIFTLAYISSSQQ